MPLQQYDHEPRIVIGHHVLYKVPGQDLAGSPNIAVLTAMRGASVIFPPDEERRLDALGMLAAPGATSAEHDAEAQRRLDRYRGMRGDQEAFARAVAPSGEAGLARADIEVEGGTPESIAAWIVAEKPNADDTVALAQGDPALAGKVLHAERIATGDDPRKGVEQRLVALAGSQ